MRTYYIVKHYDAEHVTIWEAHKRGFNSMLNLFNCWNYIRSTSTYKSPDECERLLRNVLDPIKPEVIRVVKI